MPVMGHPLTLPSDHLGLYVHVPFCARKCRYCDFPAGPCDDPTLPDRYLDALARESARRRSEILRPLHSIFIGGGTPSLLSPGQLARLWDTVIAPFPRIDDAEATIEVNPGTLTIAHLEVLSTRPITRVSLGVQSLQDDELTQLGRIHSPQQAVEAVQAVHDAGIRQVNLDLMYGIPGQTVASWANTLERALALHPTHLSCYALILEEGTPLAAQVTAGVFTLPSEDEVEMMGAVLDEYLARAGFKQYEVSNAALPGCHSRHNLGYWLGRDYLGLGAAATSMLGALRWRNRTEPVEYVTRISADLPVIAYCERLAAAERLLERVMLGLRLREGFDLAEAERECGVTLHEVAGTTVAALTGEGLLMREGVTLRLTSAGFPLANQVVARLMAGSIGHEDL
jgi:oxygen-independent coproporphyrinogen-3 oxidase